MGGKCIRRYIRVITPLYPSFVRIHVQVLSFDVLSLPGPNKQFFFIIEHGQRKKATKILLYYVTSVELLFKLYFHSLFVVCIRTRDYETTQKKSYFAFKQNISNLMHN